MQHLRGALRKLQHQRCFGCNWSGMPPQWLQSPLPHTLQFIDVFINGSHNCAWGNLVLWCVMLVRPTQLDSASTRSGLQVSVFLCTVLRCTLSGPWCTLFLIGSA